MSKRDKIAVFCSALLLFAIVAAGTYGLFRTYVYNEVPDRPPTAARP